MYMDNPGVHIEVVLDKTNCQKHKVPKGVPCWTIPKGVGAFGRYAAVCGPRIRSAGFVGKVTPQSIRSKSPSKKPSRP